MSYDVQLKRLKFVKKRNLYGKKNQNNRELKAYTWQISKAGGNRFTRIIIDLYFGFYNSSIGFVTVV